MTCNRNDCGWQATDDTCIEMIRKALDEMGYQHHDEVMDWLGQKVKQARLGAAVEAMRDGVELRRWGNKFRRVDHLGEQAPRTMYAMPENLLALLETK